MSLICQLGKAKEVINSERIVGVPAGVGFVKTSEGNVVANLVFGRVFPNGGVQASHAKLMDRLAIGRFRLGLLLGLRCGFGVSH